MPQQWVCRDIGHLGSLKSTKRLELLSAAPPATLMPLLCSANFLRAQYLDIPTQTHELILISSNKYAFMLVKTLHNIVLLIFKRNRPFPSSPWPLYQNDGKCLTFELKMIFTRKRFSQERLCTWSHSESEGSWNSKVTYCIAGLHVTSQRPCW